LIRVGWINEVTESRSFDDYDEFINSGRRTNQNDTAAFSRIRKLAPPAFDEGTD
jgi:hypothetical protein